MRSQPIREDKNGVVLSACSATSLRAADIVGVAFEISLCGETGFLIPLSALRREETTQPPEHYGEEHSPSSRRHRHCWKADRLAQFSPFSGNQLRTLGVDIKVTQELMRHASSRTTLDVYTHAVDRRKREANEKVVELMLPLDMEKFLNSSAASASHSLIRQRRRSRTKLGQNK